ncbi:MULTISPECIES: LysR substrate-binding domain-containing protein [Paraburkholderia]|uniref:Transcriptional regulator, LysR family n=1 Tax=Paraburkholderia megapolitana TaxID=420953 RepID=A0A1I3LE82_9BURK|nr:MULTISPECIES: LysR substrate-binding domain-containing protein [Paraburkholderia]MCX4164212.1 LysR substrate-binding domain-containing protein [Paraburkholderia megapolitana]MDN7159706.1 LysR substrate-binding domain-containing protein [Paraburkholderia sp. CHISQ3]MDQ6496753.1 LysR substrate-binding domain-containing protein [Paraburkholderia megapolitana]QDQ80679.1 LysR family transcriptional regulator [Paraburkholderia megapolitana]SFI83078.1 transcriptional regulator, LysR family [Parabu
MKKLDLDVLEMVVTVADVGSFARAAELIHRSSSAVSQQVKTLEDALGKPIFTRTTRNVTLTHDGSVLVEYGRKMLAMRAEAWATVVRPEVRGSVTIGVPDDYASSLLPPVLRRFAVAHPRVEIRVIGMQTTALVPLLKDNTLDLACFTRPKGIVCEKIRNEPMVWAAARGFRSVWTDRPLPLAVFEHGSTARAHAIRALEKARIEYWMSSESPSLLGLLSVVEAGLAIAPLPKCSVPPHLLHLGEAEGLPPLEDVEIVLARSARSARPPCDFLAEQLMRDLRS